MDKYESARNIPFPVLAEILGVDINRYRLRKGGTEYSGPCIFHNPRRNATSFSYAQNGAFNCFSCSEKGKGAIDALMKAKGIGFQQAIELLSPLAGAVAAYEAIRITKPPRIATVQETPVQNEIRAFTYEKYRVESGWLKERGLAQATLDRYGVFEYRNPARRSAYNGRVMIRISRFIDGGTVGYLVRDQRTEVERNGAPKYLMPEGLHKNLELFGAWQLKEDHKLPLRIVYLVESPLAVMAFHQMGLPAISPFGWSVSEAQADIIGQLAKGVICLPDRDKHAEFDPGLLSRRMWCRVPPMPVGVDDPEDLTSEQVTALT